MTIMRSTGAQPSHSTRRSGGRVVPRLAAGRAAAASAQLGGSGCCRNWRWRPPASNPLDSPQLASDAPPLTKDDLMKFFADCCKPRDQWRIGTENEKVAFNVYDFSRATFAQIEELFRRLSERHGWTPETEGGRLIAVRRGSESITLEPGGQVELSGGPRHDLHLMHAELSRHVAEVTSVGRELGLGFLGTGLDPLTATADVPAVPKATFALYRLHLRDPLNQSLMYKTATTQVNLDYGSEGDMVDKMRAGLALQPVAVALFASSPFANGAPSGYLSTRWHVYNAITPQLRVSRIPFVFDPGFGFEAYADWAASVPLLYVLRGGRVLDPQGGTWPEFVEGRLKVLPGVRATLRDWCNHLGSLYPDVRLKKIIEMRGADCGPWRLVSALPALWTGLFYDKQALKECLALTADWTQAERDALRHEVPLHGLRTRFRGATLKELSQQVLSIAEGGLARRGRGEEGLLRELNVIADSGLTLADHMLELYHGRWRGDVRHMYNEMQFHTDDKNHHANR